MTEAFICDAIRTPVGRYNGGLGAMRVDDLAAAVSRLAVGAGNAKAAGPRAAAPARAAVKTAARAAKTAASKPAAKAAGAARKRTAGK